MLIYIFKIMSLEYKNKAFSYKNIIKKNLFYGLYKVGYEHLSEIELEHLYEIEFEDFVVRFVVVEAFLKIYRI